MALSVNTNNMTGNGLLLKLGVSKQWLTELASSGWEVKLTAKKIDFVKGEHLQSIPLDLTTLNAINVGSLGVAQKIELVNTLKAAISAALSGAANATWAKDSPAHSAPPADAGGMSFVNTGLGKPKPAPAEPNNVGIDHAGPPPASKWSPFDPKKMKLAKPVKLREATQMYQPVLGTSQGSRYFLVGANEEVRVAARLQGHTLSLRIEGDGWKKHVAAIAACGFDMHGSTKDYTSMHVAVGGNMVLASKTLGAVLTGLGIPFETPVPNAKLIME